MLWVNWGNRPDRLNLSPSLLHVYNPTGDGVGLGDSLPGPAEPAAGAKVLERDSWAAAIVDGLTAAQLQTHDAVLGPALDGGYTLIGLRRPTAELFDSMVWSTPWVLDQTRRRLERARLSHALLQPLADIDEPGDLRHLPSAWRTALPLQE